MGPVLDWWSAGSRRTAASLNINNARANDTQPRENTFVGKGRLEPFSDGVIAMSLDTLGTDDAKNAVAKTDVFPSLPAGHSTPSLRSSVAQYSADERNRTEARNNQASDPVDGLQLAPLEPRLENSEYPDECQPPEHRAQKDAQNQD
jgi:hypothetical protein